MAIDGAGFARWWAHCYTRGLPPDVRDRRRAEIASDVFEHEDAEHPSVTTVVWRTLRGVPADLTWRRAQRRATAGERRRGVRLRHGWAVVTQGWFAPFAVLVAGFDLLLAWGVATEPGGKPPGVIVGPVAMGLVGLAGFVGLWLRWRSLPADASTARTGSTADPRAEPVRDRRSLADGLIIVATLPALAFFWMVIPALVAIAVIAGVAGVGSRSATS